MRKLMVLVLSIVFVLGSLSAPILAQRKMPPGQKRQIENKIRNRIKKLSAAERKAAVKTLNAKLTRLKLRQKQVQLARRRAVIASEIWRIEKELELLRAMQAAPPPGPSLVPPGQLKPRPRLTPRPIPKPIPRPRKPRSPQVGLSIGYVGGIPGALGELRFFEPLDLMATSLRLGAAYAQGEDSDKVMRKHALIVLDGIYRLTPHHTRGIRSYIGLGLNYDAYTTGQKSGALGGHAFYGVEGGRHWGGQLFFEIGYGTIRTGFSPDYTGLTALLGYKF
jgi:hypothetical protein